MKIKRIYRYPIKGLNSENLSGVHLEAGKALPFDRHFAITHGNSRFNRSAPQWVKRGNFTVVARSPELAKLRTKFNPDDLSINLESDKGIETFIVGKNGDLAGFSKVLDTTIGRTQQGPYQLVSLENKALTDSPIQAVSLLNLSSLKDLEKVVRKPLDEERFRGNFWFEGSEAWIEEKWIGKEITIGDCVLRVLEPIQRCAAIEVNPISGLRDTDLLSSLKSNYGHCNFGVLAEVLESGSIQLDSVVKI